MPTTPSEPLVGSLRPVDVSLDSLDLPSTDVSDPGRPFDVVDVDPAATADAVDPDHSPDTWRAVRDWGLVVVGAVVFALIVRAFVFTAYHIPSDSMVPTLTDGDRVVVNRLSYDVGEIDRGQVIVFDRPVMLPGEDDLIKRVVGLPGETVRLIDNQVFIDGQRLVEPYLLLPDSTRLRGTIPGCAQDVASRDWCTVPAGHVFVMGDNRNGSEDSRVFGPVSVDEIVGRAFVRVWPLGDIGRL